MACQLVSLVAGSGCMGISQCTDSDSSVLTLSTGLPLGIGMKILRGLQLFFIAIWLCTATQVMAQNKLIDVSPDILQSDNKATKVGAPDPLQLDPNWLKYYKVDGEELKARVDQSLSRIREVTGSVNISKKPEANGYVKRINASLRALLELNKVGPVQTPLQRPFQERYTVQELLKLARALRDLESIYKNQQISFEDSQKAAKAVARMIDTNVAAYRDLPESRQKKLVGGLEIMADSLSWFVSSLQEPLQRADLNKEKTKLDNLAAEVNFAKNTLIVSDMDLSKLDEKILAQTKKLDQSHKMLVTAQSKNLGVVSHNDLSPIKSTLYKQQESLAEIREAQSIVDLGILESQRIIVSLISDISLFSTQELIAQSRNQELLLKEIRAKSKKWHSRFEKARNRLSDIMFDENNLVENQSGAKKDILGLRETTKSILLALQGIDGSLQDLALLDGVATAMLAETQGPLFKFRTSSSLAFGELWKGTRDIFNKSLFSIGDVPVTSIDVIRALLIILIAYLFSRVARNILARLSESDEDKTSPINYTLGRLLHYLVIFIGLVVALASIGLNFTNLAIVAGALSVGIGFGLQSIVNNFVSGIIVLFEQNIKVGDFVELDSGMKGVVKDIHVRSTVITTFENLDIIVPNSELVTAKVINYTMNEPMFRMHIPFGVAYGTDKTLVEKAGLEAARNVEVTYDDGAQRRPQVWLTGFGESTLDFELIVWVVKKKESTASPGSWKALFCWEIESALRKYKIKIPFPQRDLHLRSGPVERESQEIRSNPEDWSTEPGIFRY